MNRELTCNTFQLKIKKDLQNSLVYYDKVRHEGIRKNAIINEYAESLFTVFKFLMNFSLELFLLNSTITNRIVQFFAALSIFA